MVLVAKNRPNVAVQSLVEQIVAAGTLSRHEHLRLTSTILADYKLTDKDRSQISRVLDYVQIGRLKLVD
jgi:hypothetical protein